MSTTPAEGFPAAFERLVDDAAMFPPGLAPLVEAVTAHRSHRASPLAPLLGPLVVADTVLPALLSRLRDDPGEGPLAVSVVVSGGAGGIEPVVGWADHPSVELVAVEVALRDLDDLAGAARRVAAAARDLERPVHVEVPTTETPSSSWEGALDEVAAADLRLKLRLGGATADLFPSPRALAVALEAALDRELPFKATAGLHHAVAHADARTGFEHHGFLNVLLAVRAALDGEDVVGTLAERDPGQVARRVVEAGDGLARARRWFTSFGCCGVEDPWHDLVALGLVTASPPDRH